MGKLFRVFALKCFFIIIMIVVTVWTLLDNELTPFEVLIGEVSWIPVLLIDRRYFFLFALYSAFYLPHLIPYYFKSLNKAIVEFEASIYDPLLNAFGIDILPSGQIVFNGKIAGIMAFECTTIRFGALFLVFPLLGKDPWLRKIVGIVIGYILSIFFNVIRIASIIYVGFIMRNIDFAHSLLSPLLSFIAALVILEVLYKITPGAGERLDELIEDMLTCMRWESGGRGKARGLSAEGRQGV